jgi:hypothetical protein
MSEAADEVAMALAAIGELEGALLVPEQAFELSVDGRVQVGHEEVGGVGAVEPVVDADEEPAMLLG